MTVAAHAQKLVEGKEEVAFVDRVATPGEALRFTPDDVVAMVEIGVLPEDASVELQGGALVYRDIGLVPGADLSETIAHNLALSGLEDVAPRVTNERRHMRTQCTLVCPGNWMPVPDGVVLRGARGGVRRLPQSEDVTALIEVANTSYAIDSGPKLAAYAHAGIPQYVIINLNNRTAEVYTSPDVTAGTYATKITVPADGTLAMRVGDAETFDVPLAELLP